MFLRSVYRCGLPFPRMFAGVMKSPRSPLNFRFHRQTQPTTTFLRSFSRSAVFSLANKDKEVDDMLDAVLNKSGPITQKPIIKNPASPKENASEVGTEDRVEEQTQNETGMPVASAEETAKNTDDPVGPLEPKMDLPPGEDVMMRRVELTEKQQDFVIELMKINQTPPDYLLENQTAEVQAFVRRRNIFYLVAIAGLLILCVVVVVSAMSGYMKRKKPKVKGRIYKVHEDGSVTYRYKLMGRIFENRQKPFSFRWLFDGAQEPYVEGKQILLHIHDNDLLRTQLDPPLFYEFTNPALESKMVYDPGETYDNAFPKPMPVEFKKEMFELLKVKLEEEDSLLRMIHIERERRKALSSLSSTSSLEASSVIDPPPEEAIDDLSLNLDLQLAEIQMQPMQVV